MIDFNDKNLDYKWSDYYGMKDYNNISESHIKKEAEILLEEEKEFLTPEEYEIALKEEIDNLSKKFKLFSLDIYNNKDLESYHLKKTDRLNSIEKLIKNSSFSLKN